MNYVVHCLSLVASLCAIRGFCMSGEERHLHNRSPTASTHVFSLLKEISLNDFLSFFLSSSPFYLSLFSSAPDVENHLNFVVAAFFFLLLVTNAVLSVMVTSTGVCVCVCVCPLNVSNCILEYVHHLKCTDECEDTRHASV